MQEPPAPKKEEKNVAEGIDPSICLRCRKPVLNTQQRYTETSSLLMC